MAYTGHGHHIPGSNKGEGITHAHNVAKCGGVRICPRCQRDVLDYQKDNQPEVDPHRLAQELVMRYLKPQDFPETPPHVIRVEMLSKSLRNWKAVVTTDDCLLFTLDHNGATNVTVISAYHMVDTKIVE